MLRYEIRSKTGKLQITTDDPLELHRIAADAEPQPPNSTQPLDEKNGYKKTVAECHRVLDKVGVATAKGVVCSDPECQSALGHRVRELAAAYSSRLSLLEQIKQIGSIEEIKKLLTDTSH